MLRPLDGPRWEALVRPGKRCRIGARVTLAGGAARATLLEHRALGARAVEIETPWPVDELMERHGLPPLPPYIERYDAPKPEDWERYQTVYATAKGSVAAPTAGLHFTDALVARLKERGIALHTVTLHVGAGTFLPVKVDDTADHKMHAEYGIVSADTANALNAARRAGGRIVAVGSTSLRLIESAAAEDGTLRPFAAETAIFITPGYHFRATDLMLTNFHLPRSTLFMLVAAFSGLGTMRGAYAHAIEHGYRFYSYGDACLLHRG